MWCRCVQFSILRQAKLIAVLFILCTLLCSIGSLARINKGEDVKEKTRGDLDTTGGSKAISFNSYHYTARAVSVVISVPSS